MSTTDQFPASAKRLYKPESAVDVLGISTPGQKVAASEKWMFDFADRTDALNVVIGTVEVVGGPNGAVARRVPLRHPEYPFLLATSARSRGKGFDATTHKWLYVEIEISFESPPYDLTGAGAFLSRSGSPSTRSLPGSPAGFRIGGIAPPFDPGDEITGEEFTYTTHQLPTLPIDVYDSVRDCVNNATFLGRAAGTVLYKGPAYNQTAQFDGTQSWEVNHSFQYSRVPFNQYRTTAGTLANMYRADGTTLKYLEADLNQVFNANG
jgi:hypothetical protein